MTLIKTLSLLTLVLFFTSFSFGQDTSDYKKALQTMFEVSGSEGAYQAAITQMFSMFKQQYANVDEQTWGELEAEFNESSILDLVDSLVPVYQKHLTLHDLNELIEFYQTPIGKKYASKTPMLTQESMQVGQQWGMKIGQDFAKKMQEKGY
jgi:hypothetical protein